MFALFSGTNISIFHRKDHGFADKSMQMGGRPKPNEKATEFDIISKITHFIVQSHPFHPSISHDGNIGTHGSCVRSSGAEKQIHTVVGTDARTVRPYMPLANNSSYYFANPKVQYSNFNIQSLQILKVKVQCSKFKIKVPTYA